VDVGPSGSDIHFVAGLEAWCQTGGRTPATACARSMHRAARSNTPARPQLGESVPMPRTVRSIAVTCVIAGSALLAGGAQQRVLAHPDGHATHGGDGRTFAAGEPGDPKKATRRVIEIVMSEGPGTMSFSPDRVEVRKGEQVRFVLKNIGELRH